VRNEDATAGFNPPPPLTVQVERGSTAQSELRFTSTFRVGRSKECDIQLQEPSVSRVHLEVSFDGERWRVRDLGSSNGTYLEGSRIQEAVLPDRARLEVGRGGPVLWLTVEAEDEPSRIEAETALRQRDQPVSVTQVISRYFVESGSDQAGHHTMTIRRAFARVHKQRSRKYRVMIAAAVLLLVGSAGVIAYQYMKLQNLKAMAEGIFYAMKSLELQVAKVDAAVPSQGDARQRSEMVARRAQLLEMQKRYDGFIEEIGLYKRDLSEEERMIFRVARIFGECEVNMPDRFVREVKRYIAKWKTTDRLENAIRRAEQRDYTTTITRQMLENHLPPQFFYLALKESQFFEHSVGPKTRWGVAKGIWQFVPATAIQYGLQTGPLVELPRFDPLDERFQFPKATSAAGKYLRDIYSTEAQASGLLVIAAYNWGHNRVRSLIQGMPENPRERNFWTLLQHHQIPVETYEYVLYIFAAAVIGENPDLFGFGFKNPLADVS